MQTLLDIYYQLGDLALQHNYVNAYFAGGSIYSINSEVPRTYPYLYISAVGDHVVKENTTEYRLSIFYVDRLLDDDSNGVIAGIEVAKQIMAMGTPEYSLRLIFAMELYGFAAFHANFKGKVIGGANLDTLPGGSHYQFNVVPPITTKPFHGLEFLDEFCGAFHSIIPCKKTSPECFDDMFLSEIVGIDVDPSLIDESGKLCLDRVTLTAYAHGEYYELGKKIGKFGFSVKQKHHKKH